MRVPPGEKAAVLVVDDRDEVRVATADLLRSLGYPVLTASSGREAAKIYESKGLEIAAVVTDLDMPEIDGLELADRVRAVETTVPVVVASSGVDERVATRARQGEIAFLQKPFTSQQLAAALERAIERRPDPDITPVTASGPSPAASVAETPRGSGSAVRKAGRWSMRLAWVLGLALAGIGSAVMLRPVAPSLPERPSETIRRGGVVALVSPAGLVGELPERYRWQPVPAAASYRLTLQAVDDEILWSAETVDAEIAPPAEVVGGQHRGVAYFWRVEGMNEAGAVVAVSPRLRYQVRLGRLGEEREQS